MLYIYVYTHNARKFNNGFYTPPIFAGSIHGISARRLRGATGSRPGLHPEAFRSTHRGLQFC